MLGHGLPDEEGGSIRGSPPPDAVRVVIVRPPYASNLDEFHHLAWAARVSWATRPTHLDGADLVILPGSKNVAADARWMRSRGLDEAIVARAGAGGRVIGICGGAMLLGRDVADPHGIEGSATGLGLLPLSTVLDRDKITTATSIRLEGLEHPWDGLNGHEVAGYQIRHGRIEGDVCQVSSQVWADGGVLATTVHGLFETPEVLESVTGVRPRPVLEPTFDHLADALDRHLEMGRIEAMLLG